MEQLSKDSLIVISKEDWLKADFKADLIETWNAT